MAKTTRTGDRESGGAQMAEEMVVFLSPSYTKNMIISTSRVGPNAETTFRWGRSFS